MAKDLLDLHGVTEDEVFDRVEAFVGAAQSNGLSKVRIMTGKGKGIVKKKVLEYLKLGRYHSTPEKLKNGQVNDGVLVVFLE